MGELKDVSVTFRVPAALYVQVQQAAMLAEQRPSVWLRAAVEEKLGRPTLVDVLVEALRGSDVSRPGAAAGARLSAAQQRAADEKRQRWLERQKK